jgi:hypothetical protein
VKGAPGGKSKREDGTFSRSEFTFDAQANRYTCPAGKFLKPTWRMKRRNPNMYRASQLDCQSCPLKLITTRRRASAAIDTS